MKRSRNEDGTDQFPDYVAAVKAGQRSSQNFKDAWHLYCERCGQTYFDPARHDNHYLQSFFDQLAQGYITMIKGPNAVGCPTNATGGGATGAGTGTGGGSRTGGPGGGNNMSGGGPGGMQSIGPMGMRQTNNGSISGGGGANNSGGSQGGQRNFGVGSGRVENTPLKRCQELVKMGQRNSAEWKQLWIDWCQVNFKLNFNV